MSEPNTHHHLMGQAFSGHVDGYTFTDCYIRDSALTECTLHDCIIENTDVHESMMSGCTYDSKCFIETTALHDCAQQAEVKWPLLIVVGGTAFAIVLHYLLRWLI